MYVYFLRKPFQYVYVPDFMLKKTGERKLHTVNL